ncbi:hypothetical protein LWF01_13245 [Saxibacter everestensis]|uniref:Rv3660c-like CheY-like N-terminal domain-containing protein n=1 Tax=Saxibacter everestensis TaxID=2909229 RepID=A0ABY8QSC0_9MICO|nr:hypothetical protein LWF01_13245 [Brevibacteriaceae bacterium ZFBP1038]
MRSTQRSVVVFTGIEELSDEVRRLASSAGVELLVPGRSASSWRDAALLLVGEDINELPGHASAERVVVALDSGGSTAQVWRHATELRAEHVALLPDAAEWLVQRMISAVEPATPTGLVLGVVGGSGGAGASTLACGLARAASISTTRSALIDADPLGGGLDLVLGAEGLGGIRWPNLTASRGSLRPSALYEALPRLENLSVLSWDRTAARELPQDLFDSVLTAARHAFALLVIDLPRHAPIDCTRWCDRLLLVTCAQVRAAVAANQVARRLSENHPDVRLVVRGPVRSGLAADGVARSLGLELEGYLKPDRGLAEALDRGEGIPKGRNSRLARLSEEIIAQVTELAS